MERVFPRKVHWDDLDKKNAEHAVSKVKAKAETLLTTLTKTRVAAKAALKKKETDDNKSFLKRLSDAPDVINAAIEVMEGLLSMDDEGWLTADLKQAKATINGDTKKLNGINQLIGLLT